MTEVRSNSSPVADLLLTLNRDGTEPLHRQIAASIRDGIRDGRLIRDSALPATRMLAASLDLSRGVVVEAYQQLKAEGYLASKPGGYTVVAAGLAGAAAGTRSAAGTGARAPGMLRPAPGAAPPRIDFRYGRCDPRQFPRAAWLRSVRQVLTAAPAERFGYLSGQGVPELRQALADYLNRVRGTAASPDSIVICNGFAQGIALLFQVLAARGAQRVAVEDPSSAGDLLVPAGLYGITLLPVPVAADGIRAEALNEVNADAVIVTPSHQWPTGAVLGPDRRAELLSWARRTGGLIIEDDYDAEFRYDRAPVGALHGLAPDHVIYAGTASKTLAPGLRLGWLLLPPALAGEVAEAKIDADRGSPVIDQLAFADFLARGEFDRHLRRMRPVYRRRRDALLGALDRHLPSFCPSGISAGFHLITWLPPSLGEEEVTAAGARAGVGVYGVAPYRTLAGPPALLFGYAGLSEQAIGEGIRLLAGAIS
ncbi:MAG TPA: PLP-dependent aminotransferase family protein [Streptosporangiaceae bacterium]|nr:PLP-dependent aminotransferase family protein [Streptosporangiaceae bacterium]